MLNSDQLSVRAMSSMQPVPFETPPVLDVDRDALFLDLDGTLVEIASRPDSIRVPAALKALLVQARNGLCGRLAIVSGRSLADLDRHLGVGLGLAAGTHGAELRGAGALIHAPEWHRALARMRLALSRFDTTGLLIEDKDIAIAIHYRDRPERQEEALVLAQHLAALSDGLFIVQRGRMVAELKPAGFDKGSAVRAFLEEPIFAGARPVFIGDDLTDEAGFQACAALGGYGVLVGEPRQSAARYGLEDVEAVHRWIAAGLNGSREGLSG